MSVFLVKLRFWFLTLIHLVPNGLGLVRGMKSTESFVLETRQNWVATSNRNVAIVHHDGFLLARICRRCSLSSSCTFIWNRNQGSLPIQHKLCCSIRRRIGISSRSIAAGYDWIKSCVNNRDTQGLQVGALKIDSPDRI